MEKFLPNLTEVANPFRDLLKREVRPKIYPIFDRLKAIRIEQKNASKILIFNEVIAS